MQRPAISYYVLTGVFLIDTRVLSFIIWFLKALIAYIVQQVLNPKGLIELKAQRHTTYIQFDSVSHFSS